MVRVFVATCEACGFAMERGQLAVAVAEADMHEGTTGHRTRVVEVLLDGMSERADASTRPAGLPPAGPMEMPTLKVPKAGVA